MVTSSKKPKKVVAKKAKKKWSGRVTRQGNALDLKQGLFASNDPKKIARSLKRSADQSHRRKSSPYRSAMSMLTFYIHRGGKALSPQKKRTLNWAKDELRALYKKA